MKSLLEKLERLWFVILIGILFIALLIMASI